MFEDIVRLPQIVTTATTHFPYSAQSLLNSALQLVSQDIVDGRTGRLVEDSGPGRVMRLEVEVPLLDGEGERILGLFLRDGPHSPDLEVDSHNGNWSLWVRMYKGSRRLEPIQQLFFHGSWVVRR
jgi:hypothetical protein